jgi:alpha-L-rhamnosidase
MKAFMTHLLEVYPDGFTPISEISTTAPYGEHRGEGYFEARNAWDLAIKAGIPREEANKLFRTPHDLLGAMQTYEGLLTIIKVARVLREEQDVKTYEALASRVGKRINSHMDEATGAYAKDSQSLQVLALANNIPRQEHHAKVLDYLKRNIVETRKGHFSVGATQLREFFRVLSKEGEGALAVKVMHQPGAPGFVDMLSHGLTAVWERWDGKGSFNSHDYATVADWFFADLAGIQPDPQLPGFKRIVFKPDLACGLESASADYESVRGRIVSDWKIENGRIVYDILVPPGCEGKVLLPASADIVSPPDATRKGQENGHAVFLTGSGKFRFEIPVSDNK